MASHDAAVVPSPPVSPAAPTALLQLVLDASAAASPPEGGSVQEQPLEARAPAGPLPLQEALLQATKARSDASMGVLRWSTVPGGGRTLTLLLLHSSSAPPPHTLLLYAACATLQCGEGEARTCLRAFAGALLGTAGGAPSSGGEAAPAPSAGGCPPLATAHSADEGVVLARAWKEGVVLQDVGASPLAVDEGAADEASATAEAHVPRS